MDNVRVLKVDTGAAQTSVKGLRKELKQLKDTMVSAEKGSAEYAEALKRAAEIQHDLKEQMEEVNAVAMDFGQIAGNVVSATGGMVAGFQAAKATLSLFGVENEGVMKSLQKMQALMAITQALPGIEKGIKSIKALGTVIANATTSTKAYNAANQTTTAVSAGAATATKGLQGAMVGEAAATAGATAATHAFKKALISTGIGAIVVLVGTLIAHLEDLAKWLGFGGESTEALEKKTLKLKQTYESMNATYQQYSTNLEGMKFQHEQRIKVLELEIEKMKAAGASEAELTAKRQELLNYTKQAAQEEVDYLNKEQASIEKEYLKLMKGIAGATYSTTLTMQNMYYELAEAQRLVLNNEQELARLEANDADKKDIEKQKQRIEQAKQRVTLLNTYIASQKEEININDKVNSNDTKVTAEKVQRRKKANEDLAKFDEQLLIDGKKNKDKELAQIDKSEKEKLKQLKEMRKQGEVTEKGYQERVTKITEIYSKQRAEIEYKYAEEAYRKRESIYKANLDIEIKQLETANLQKQQALKQESGNLVNALQTRKISIIDYFEGEKEIAAKSYEAEREMLDAKHAKEIELIERQIDEKNELLAQDGITEEQRNQIVMEMNTLTQQMSTADAQYAAELQNMAAEHNAFVQGINQETIEIQMDSLRQLTENIVGAMDAITACGEGLSSNWATAFDTMSNGLINLGQKIKEGGAAWQDYAQLAVAAFQSAGAVMSALADEQETETKEGFEKQKQYQIAAATMNMLGGVISAWVSAMNPANAWMTIWGQLAMGAVSTAMILATGIMQINKIKQQQFKGGGSTGGSPNAGAVSSVVAPVQYTQDVQGASIEGSIKDSKVYVTETDITDTQNRVEVSETEARY